MEAGRRSKNQLRWMSCAVVFQKRKYIDGKHTNSCRMFEMSFWALTRARNRTVADFAKSNFSEEKWLTKSSRRRAEQNENMFLLCWSLSNRLQWKKGEKAIGKCQMIFLCATSIVCVWTSDVFFFFVEKLENENWILIELNNRAKSSHERNIREIVSGAEYIIVFWCSFYISCDILLFYSMLVLLLLSSPPLLLNFSAQTYLISYFFRLVSYYCLYVGWRTPIDYVVNPAIFFFHSLHLHSSLYLVALRMANALNFSSVGIYVRQTMEIRSCASYGSLKKNQ